MFAFPNTGVSDGKWISQTRSPMPFVPQMNGLSDLQERILLAIWKLRGMGQYTVDEGKLRTELMNESTQDMVDASGTLVKQGFLEKKDADNRTSFSLTSLGLAILRKLEEDRLQELK